MTNLVKTFGYTWILAVTILVLVSCTLSEWGKIGNDALEQAPEAVVGVAQNPTPVGIAVVVASFVSGLFAKSAARNFGKAAKGTGNKVYDVSKRIIDVISKKTTPTDGSSSGTAGS